MQRLSRRTKIEVRGPEDRRHPPHLYRGRKSAAVPTDGPRPRVSANPMENPDFRGSEDMSPDLSTEMPVLLMWQG